MYGYARVSVREPEDKNLDLQVERLVRAGCSMGNIRAEEASGAKDDRGGLLELLDLVVEGDTLVVTHIDRLSRGLTYGLQVIEGLHHAGVEFRSLSEDFDTSTATGKLQLADGARLQRVVAQLDQGPLGRRPGEGAGRGAFPWPEAQPDRAAKGLHPGGAVEGSGPAGTGQAPGGQPLDHPAGGQVGVGWAMQPLHGAWPVGSLPSYAFRTLPANGQTLRRRPLESSRSQSGQVSPHLMARPQITYNFHHYLAVNFVIVSNLIHHRQLARPSRSLLQDDDLRTACATRLPSPTPCVKQEDRNPVPKGR